MLFRECNICQRMLDIAFTLGSILYGAFVAGQFFQGSESFIDGSASSGGAVKNATGTLRSGGGAGQQIGRDGIIDVRKIAAGCAIAKNYGLLSAQHLHAESGK